MKSVFLPALSSMLLASPALAFEAQSSDIDGTITNEFVFAGFGCSGENKSPAVSWKNAPEGTKSFALMVHDPDAPTGGAGWWHWVVVNIPASTASLAKGAGNEGGSLPDGASQIATDFGAPGWGGPCPPEGDKPHRYNFTVYALGVEKLELPAGATASLAGFMINGNAIGKATFTGTYGR